MLRLLKKEKGFTLIELMVVVLIIAILVAIAIPIFGVAQNAAKRRTCQANLRTLDGAIQTYNADWGDFPPSGSYDNLCTNYLVPNYIKRAPSCPAGGDYTYNYKGGTPDTANVTCSSTVGGEHRY